MKKMKIRRQDLLNKAWDQFGKCTGIKIKYEGSGEFEAQTGYPPEEALGRNCRFLQGPGTDPNAIQAIRDALAAETEITIDILNYRKDGTEFWNRLRIRPLFDEKGKLKYFAGAQNPIPAEEARPYPIGAVFD
jgi:PAS domain S-box-containing protein